MFPVTELLNSTAHNHQSQKPSMKKLDPMQTAPTTSTSTTTREKCSLNYVKRKLALSLGSDVELKPNQRSLSPIHPKSTKYKSEQPGLPFRLPHMCSHHHVFPLWEVCMNAQAFSSYSAPLLYFTPCSWRPP